MSPQQPETSRFTNARMFDGRSGVVSEWFAKNSEPTSPSSSPANAAKMTEFLSIARFAVSTRAISRVTAGPEPLSFAAGKTVPSGSVPIPSRCPPTSTNLSARCGSFPRRMPTTFCPVI